MLVQQKTIIINVDVNTTKKLLLILLIQQQVSLLLFFSCRETVVSKVINVETHHAATHYY